MSSQTLYRLGGISLLIGSLLVIIGDIPSFFIGNDHASTIFVASSLMRMLGAMLIVLGLPCIYARIAGHVGILGLIGFTCTFFSMLIGMASESILTFIFPFLTAHGLLGGGHPPQGLIIFYSVGDLLRLVGGISLGIAVLRIATLPRLVGMILIVGSLLYTLASILRLPGQLSDVGLIVFIFGLAWLAAGMWSKPLVTVEVPVHSDAMRA